MGEVPEKLNLSVLKTSDSQVLMWWKFIVDIKKPKDILGSILFM